MHVYSFKELYNSTKLVMKNSSLCNHHRFTVMQLHLTLLTGFVFPSIVPNNMLI